MSGYDEYILFLHSSNEAEKYRSEFKTTKPIFEIWVCGGHPVRYKAWDTFLNKLVSLSNIQYELEGILPNKVFYQGIWKIPDTLVNQHISLHKANICDAIGGEIDLRIFVDKNIVEILVERNEILSGWYFFRYRSGSFWITLPFVYYEERIYGAIPGIAWKNRF